MNYARLIFICSLAACSGKASESSTQPVATPTPHAAPSSSPSPTTNPPAAPTLAPAVPPATPAVAAAAEPVAHEPANTQPSASSSADCSFTPLNRFEGRVVKWEGECVGGKADGYGALRAYPRADSEDKNVLIFFGKLRRGKPALGVLDLPNGFQAGKVVAGEVTGYDDRDLAIEALDEGTKAARQVSERMKAAGNAASAAFYDKKAKMLAIQLGD